MIGEQFSSEKKLIIDSSTGREIWQLTSGKSNNYHLYFTDNSFSIGDKEIYFLSDRSSDKPKIFNFFKMDLDSGIITQLTDEEKGITLHTKTPDSEIVVYTTENKVKKLDTGTGKTDQIFEANSTDVLAAPFISCDKKYVGIIRNENVNIERGNNYSGFKERYYNVKTSKITIIYLDGSKAIDVHNDTHQLGHFQFSPNDPTLAMFCHEGPWNLVTQRIWFLDIVSRSVVPCFRQGEDDCVGHEFWTRDGLIFFDNRRKGHDGTITSDRKQLAKIEEDSGQIPYVGLVDNKGNVIKEIEMPFYFNHYHANNENSLLVGDDVDYICLLDISGEKTKLTKLCYHGTSWLNAKTHCHPTFSWKGDKILFASDKDGKINLYMIKL